MKKSLLILILLSLLQAKSFAQDVEVYVDGRLLPASDSLSVPAVSYDYVGFPRIFSTTAFVEGEDTLRIVNKGDMAVRALLTGTKIASSTSRSVTLVLERKEGILRDVESRGVVSYSILVPPHSSVPVCFGIDFNREGNFGTVVSSLVIRWGGEAGVSLLLTHEYSELSPVVPSSIDEKLSNGARDVYGRRLSLKDSRWAPGLYLVNRQKTVVR